MKTKKWILKTKDDDKPHISKWWVENEKGEYVVDETLQWNEVGGIDDGQLIAAAPELLEACKAVIKGGYGCAPSVEYMDELKKKCEAAINKAVPNLIKPLCPECLQQTTQEELEMFGGLCEECTNN